VILKPPDKSLRVATDEQVDNALDIVKPAADRRDACRGSVRWEFGYVHSPWIPPPTPPSQHRKEILKVRKVLRGMEEICSELDPFQWPSGWPSRKQIEEQRRFYEWFTEGALEPRRSGSRRDPVQVRAVRAAYRLSAPTVISTAVKRQV
jgi:hypothetical protein